MARIAKLPHDLQLPTLGAVADGAVVQRAFENDLSEFADGHLQIKGVEIKKLQYRPGVSCRISYRIRVRNRDTGLEDKVVYIGKISANGDFRQALELCGRNGTQGSGGQAGMRYLAGLNMCVWAFPYDPALNGLDALVDPDYLAGLFDRQRAELHLAPQNKLGSAHTKLIKYVAEDRCTLRHELHVEDRENIVVFSKTLTENDRPEQLFNAMRVIYRALNDLAGSMIAPEPLFYLPELQTFFMEGLRGENADDSLDKIDLARAGKEIGAGIACIHQTHIDGLKPLPDRAVLDNVEKALRNLENLDPVYRQRIESMIERLEARLPELPAFPDVPIHTAFRISQLLVVDKKFALIDFDGFALGNPLLDVASFISYLLYLPVKGRLSMEQSVFFIRNFCEAYAANAPWGLPENALAWHTAATLVRKHANRCLRRAKEDYHISIPRLLGTAEDILSGKQKLLLD